MQAGIEDAAHVGDQHVVAFLLTALLVVFAVFFGDWSAGGERALDFKEEES